jgi:hypothetical protein
MIIGMGTIRAILPGAVNGIAAQARTLGVRRPFFSVVAGGRLARRWSPVILALIAEISGHGFLSKKMEAVVYGANGLARLFSLFPSLHLIFVA